MHLKLTPLFLIIFIALVTVAGCGRSEGVVTDTIPNDTPDETAGPRVKVVWLLDYREGGTAAYTRWQESVASTLKASAGVNRIRDYENLGDTGPRRYLSFEFESFLDAKAYMDRREIEGVFNAAVAEGLTPRAHTFVERAAHAKTQKQDWAIKGIMFIDYPPGGRQAYLNWTVSVAPVLITPPQLKSIATYENESLESPNRLVELAFASQEDVLAYGQLESIMAVDAAHNTYAERWGLYVFALRSDDINEVNVLE